MADNVNMQARWPIYDWQIYDECDLQMAINVNMQARLPIYIWQIYDECNLQMVNLGVNLALGTEAVEWNLRF